MELVEIYVDRAGSGAWLEEELRGRAQWGMPPLPSRLSDGALARLLEGSERPSGATCEALAHAPGVSTDLVRRWAGYLPLAVALPAPPARS